MDLPKCSKCGKITALLINPVLMSFEPGKRVLVQKPMYHGGSVCRACAPTEVIYVTPLRVSNPTVIDIAEALEVEVARLRGGE